MDSGPQQVSQRRGLEAAVLSFRKYAMASERRQ